jgi:hypothetical protein
VLIFRGLRRRKRQNRLCTDQPPSAGTVDSAITSAMYLKRHLRRKGGKEHVYYSVSESTRVSNRRSVQRQVLRLGELNTTQLERWQRSIEVLEENGQSRQLRLFTDRDAAAPRAEDVCEVLLSSLAVRRPREFGAPWLGCRLFEAMGFDEFFGRELADHRGPQDWAKVVELLTVNRKRPARPM